MGWHVYPRAVTPVDHRTTRGGHHGCVRAFLAVWPPNGVVADLDRCLQPLREAAGSGSGRWRWTRPGHLHLTLAFLSALSDDGQARLVAESTDWAARQTPLRVSLGGTGAFPGPGRAKVLWVGIQPDGATRELRRWSRSLRELASQAGVHVDDGEFVPHVTVARSKRPRPAGRLVRALEGYQSARFELTQVALVRSHLGQGPGGSSRYEVTHRFPLGG